MSNNYYNVNEELFAKSLIEKKDIKDCYTKAYTLQKQGCDMFALFWKIYIDYYAHTNPKLEAFIMKKQTAWINKNDNNHIIYVIKNLFISNSTQNVYNLRNYIMNGGLVNYIYTVKTEKTIYTNLKISMKRKHYENVAYELVNIVNKKEEIDKIFDVIIRYFTKHYGGADREKINEKWKNRPQIPNNIIAYYLLAMVLHLYEEESNITQTTSVVVPRKEEVDFYLSLS
jgi:hypothetical protein